MPASLSRAIALRGASTSAFIFWLNGARQQAIHNTCARHRTNAAAGRFRIAAKPFRSAFPEVVVSNSAHMLPPNLDRRLYQPSLHPLRALLLGAANAFLVSGFLSDWAYFSDHQIQWKNFADWLIIGGLVFAGFALVWALIDLFRSSLDGGWRIIAFGLLLCAFVLGIVDELVHAKDGWASMPDALIISAVVAVLAVAA